MNRFMKSLTLMLALGGATACGEELADSTYSGEARYTVSGEVQSLSPVETQGKTRVSLVWDNWARNGDVVSFQSVELTSKNPPFDYALSLLDDPATGALNDFQPGLLGTAYIVVYEDLDGDGTLNEGDTMRGMASRHLMLFVPEVTPELKAKLQEWGRIQNLEDLKPGYNLARGICHTGEDYGYDDLRIVSNEPVPVASMEALNEGGCLNFH